MYDLNHYDNKPSAHLNNKLVISIPSKILKILDDSLN